MESSRLDFFIYMVVHWFTLNNTQITFSSCFTFVPKTDVGLPKTGAGFYCGELCICMHVFHKTSIPNLTS